MNYMSVGKETKIFAEMVRNRAETGDLRKTQSSVIRNGYGKRDILMCFPESGDKVLLCIMRQTCLRLENANTLCCATQVVDVVGE